jgi:hypothetical protein
MNTVVRNLSWMIIAGALAFSGPAVAAGGPSVSGTAEYLEVSDGVTSRGKYSFGPEGIRMEGEIDGEPGLVIINFSRNVVWNVSEAERIYMEMPLEAPKSGSHAGPCDEEVVHGELLSGKRIGTETLDGREVEKWECTVPDGVDRVWYDARLQLPVRSHDWDGTRFELRNIRETRLSPGLFQPPAGYARVAIPGGAFTESPGKEPVHVPDVPAGGGEQGSGLMEGLRSLLGS